MQEDIRGVVGMPPELFSWHEVCSLGFYLYREILQDVVREACYEPQSYYEETVWKRATEAQRRGELFVAKGPTYAAPWKREVLLPRFVRSEKDELLMKQSEWFVDDHVWGTMAHSQPYQRRTLVCNVPDAGGLCLVKHQDWLYWVILLPQNSLYDAPSGAVSRMFFGNLRGAVVSLADRALYYTYKVNNNDVHVLLSIEHGGIYPTHQDRISKSVSILYKAATTLRELTTESHGMCAVLGF